VAAPFAKHLAGMGFWTGAVLCALGAVAACSGREIKVSLPEALVAERVSAAPVVAAARVEGSSAELNAPSTKLATGEPDIARTESDGAETEPNLARTESDGAETEPNLAKSEPNGAATEPNLAKTEPDGAATEAETARAAVDGPVRTPFEPRELVADGSVHAPLNARELVATAREVIVYAEPTRSARRLGYLRLGARVQRAPASAGHDGCAHGWYRIGPEGYVCVGNAATLDEHHPLAELARTRPDREAALPYAYGRSKPAPPPLYTHLPSAAEIVALEGKMARGTSGFADLTPRALPPELANGAALPMPFGYARASIAETPRALPNSAFALLDVVEQDGRRFAITTDLELVPLDRLTRVEASAFHGVVLDETTTLPLVFVRSKHAVLFSGSPEHGFRPARPLAYREALSLGERSATIGGVRYLETRAGTWLADVELVHVAASPRPAGVRGERTWVHVSITDQSLVAYAGARPVFATLVSTGRDGLGDPVTTHSTPRGEFVIHTKHVSVTMNGDEVGDEFDLRDVPYVAYFTQGFAFHAAYWHDAFGAPHSHGCVNLSPLDARWLFDFTEPAVPQGWHGAFSRDGTYVSITP
jgi:hypothetical protein